MTRTKRDCQCPQANHLHGTYLAYVVDGCRCSPCTNATTKEAHQRDLRRTSGHAKLVDAADARTHLHRLTEQGMGLGRIGRRAGVSTQTLRRLAHGTSQRVHRTTAAAVLGVTLDLADHALTEGTGTRRRLQALVALGWPQTRLAERLGWSQQAGNEIINGTGHVQVRTAAAVCALYDQLWDQTPSAATRFEAAGIARAATAARQHGWVSPLAWDDDIIDDPAATPNLGAERGEPIPDELAIHRAVTDAHAHVDLTDDETTAVIARLAHGGHSDAQIAHRLGVHTRTVMRRRHAHHIPAALPRTA